jgi:hypothetical protein
MRGRIKPRTDAIRKCATCTAIFTPVDDRQIYCCTSCRSNAPNKKITTQKFQQSRRNDINAIKVARGCSVCGYNEHPAALDFNHVRGEKLFNVSQDTKTAWSKVLEEIAKCDVLCANCHRIHTYENRHWHTKRKQQ